MRYDSNQHRKDMLRCLASLLPDVKRPEGDESFLEVASADDVASLLSHIMAGKEEKQANLERLQEIRRTIEEGLKTLSEEEREKLPLIHLQKRYSLSEKELMILLMGAAPELDSRFKTIFGFLQNDMSQKYPGIGFICDVLSPLWHRGEIFQCFEENSPLLKNTLIHFFPESSLFHSERSLVADKKVVRFLLGEKDALLDGNVPFAHLLESSSLHWNDIVLPADRIEELKQAVVFIRNRCKVYETWGFGKNNIGRGINILLSGPSGTGKTLAARIIANAVGQQIYRVDIASTLSQYVGLSEKHLSQIFESVNDGKIVFLDECDSLLCKRASQINSANDRYSNIEVAHLLMQIEGHRGVVIMATNFLSNLDDALMRRLNMVISFPMPEESEREAIWRRIFPTQAPIDKIDFSILKQWELSGGNIWNIALSAAFLASEENRKIEMKDIIVSARREMERLGKIFKESIKG